MAWLAAIPDLLTAAGFLLIWLRTDLTGPAWVANGVATMLLEFFVVHASGFFVVILYSDGARARRSLYLAGLSSLYLLIITGYAWGMHAWWMIGAFFWLGFGKGVALWSKSEAGDRDRRQMAAMVGWAASVVCYLGAAAASVLLQWPAYGVTPALIQAAGYGSGGVWEEQPYRALAAGALYFGAMALLRLLIGLTLLRTPRPSSTGTGARA